MAYVQNFQDDENDPLNPKNKADTSGNVTQTSTGGSGYVGAGQGVAPQSAGSSSGRWNNLQNYLSSNQGANTERLGGAISDKSTDLTNTANAQTNQIKTNTAQAADQNTVRQDQGVLDGLKNDPSKVNLDGFKKLAQAQYKGPQAEDFSGSQAQRDSADTYADQVQSTDIGKKEQALKSTFNNSNYNRGSAVLDSFIGFGNDDQNKRISSTASGNQQSLRDTLSNAQRDNTEQINQARNTTDQTRQQTNDAFNTAVGQSRTGIDASAKTLADRLAAKKTNVAGITSGLDSSDSAARNAAYAKLGISGDAGDKFLKSGAVNRNNIFNVNGDQSLGDVVDDSTQSRYAALSGLGASIGNNLQGYDFNKTGNSADDFNINQDRIASLNELGGLSKKFDTRLSSQNAERQSQQNRFKDLMSRYQSGLTNLSGIGQSGIDGEIEMAGQQYGFGKDVTAENLLSSAKYGRDLNIGDVVNDSERSRFKSLLDMVGGGDNPYGSLDDLGDEGSAVGLDQQNLTRLKNEGLASQAQQQEMLRLKQEEDDRLAMIASMKKKMGSIINKSNGFNGAQRTQTSKGVY
jgi:hypothetical protein